MMKQGLSLNVNWSRRNGSLIVMNELSKRIARLSPEQRELFLRRLKKEGVGADPLGQIEPRIGSEPAPLSFSQQRMWFLNQLAPGNPFYNEPLIAIRLTGTLCVKGLRRTIEEIARRHEILRTIFPSVDGHASQVIVPATSISFPMIDLTALPYDRRETELKRLAEEEVRRPVVLETGPLFRVSLIKMRDSDHVVFFEIHHIAFDGWSGGVLIHEVTTLYDAYSSGRSSPLPDLPIQYADYAAWQHEKLHGEVLDKLLSYWKRELSGPLPNLRLPTDFLRPHSPRFIGRRHSLRLSSELRASLEKIASGVGATLFMALYAVFVVLLHSYTAQRDIVIGTPVAGRSRMETEGLIGFFVNTLVLRCKLDGNPTFSTLLKRVREVVLGAYEHQDMPFEKLVECLQPDRKSDLSPLFRVLFGMHNYPPVRDRLQGLIVEHLEVDSHISKFDLALSITDLRGDGLIADVEYNTDLFRETTISLLLEQFSGLLERVADDPGARLDTLSYVVRDVLQGEDKGNTVSEDAFLDRLGRLRSERDH